MSVYAESNFDTLYHHGVKGMKWGIRKSKPNSVSNKNYSDKQRKQDRAFYGKGGEKRINKRLNEGHGLQGARHYEVERKERQEKVRKIVKKGAKKTSKVLTKIGMTYVFDQMFNEGRGTRLVKETVKQTGRAVVSAYIMARGGWDIRWYDK